MTARYFKWALEAPHGQIPDPATGAPLLFRTRQQARKWLVEHDREARPVQVMVRVERRAAA